MATITPPFVGCTDYDDLPDALVWVLIADGPNQYFQAGAWMTDKAGCRSQTHHQRALLINGDMRSPDIGELITVTFDYKKQFKSQTVNGKPCGGAQIDIKHAQQGGLTLHFVGGIINTGRDCGKGDTPPILPPIIEPPIIPPVVPPPSVIPEPSSMLLLGSALVWAAWRKR